jgi:nitroreductase
MNMELTEIIGQRKSIRAFRNDPLSREQVEAILDLAIKAPSAINLQPWEFSVVMNEERERLSRRLVKAYREKQISCSPGNVKPLPREFTARGVESFEAMKPYLDEMGSDFNRYINEGSCNFYGAPVAIIISIDNSFSKARLVDIGVCLGYLVLAAHNAGLWTCPIGLITAYEEEVKDVLNIAETKDVVIGVALGYPDRDSPINRFASPRDKVAGFVRWID